MPSQKAKTVLITGTSTGIGRATVKAFSAKGWNVAATMRSPQKEAELQTLPGVELLQLDVTDEASIQRAFAQAKAKFGGIDVVVNNAGYAVVGAFEETSDLQIEKQFDTNVFGLMKVVRAAIQHFRGQGGGRILNVSSVGGRLTFPIYSLYHGTKWAVEGFTESLQYELKPLGISVGLIEPGAIKTDFYDRSAEMPEHVAESPYRSFVSQLMKKYGDVGSAAIGPEAVANTIVSAASTSCLKLRNPVGFQAKVLLILKRLLPDKLFSMVIRSSLGI